MSVWDLCTAHWNLDDLVEEVGGLDLTNTNSTPFAAGALGDCADFDGNASGSARKLSRASAAALQDADEWTVSFWWKSSRNNGGDGAWLGKGVYSSPGYEWAVRPIDNSSVWVYISSSGTDFPYGQFNLGSGFLNDGAWHHGVVRFKGSGATNADRLRMWSDAVEKTGSYSGSIPATMFTGSGDFILGAMFANILGYSAIRIDHVSFFAGTALDQAEVDELFNGGTPLVFAGGGGPPDDVVESPGSAIALAGAAAADELLVPGCSAAGAGGRTPAQLLAVGSSSAAAGATPANAAATTGPALAAAGATPAGAVLATGTASAGARARPAASILSGLVAAAAAAARALWALLAPGRARAAATAALPAEAVAEYVGPLEVRELATDGLREWSEARVSELSIDCIREGSP